MNPVTAAHLPATPSVLSWRLGLLALPVLALVWTTSQPAAAQSLEGPSTQQRAQAQQVAQAGVPLGELSPDAPARYSVKPGDTLWGLSALFLRSPWRWPELWGQNLADVRNPHRIYPGQVLVLDTSSGRALLKLQGGQASGNDEAPPTVRVSPRTRYEALSESAIPPIAMQDIAPFLAEALIVDEAEFEQAPRVVAAQEGRVLLSRGDRAYARSLQGAGADGGLNMARGDNRQYRVFRGAHPLKDPANGTLLGFEAQYVGKVELVRPETVREITQPDGKVEMVLEPATIDIVAAKEEIRAGDRLLPEPVRDYKVYVPHAPEQAVAGQVVSVYGSAVTHAAQNQVVVINRGSQQGLQEGHVLAILKDGSQVLDRTDEKRPMLHLPNERNGLMMVFRTFDRLSYALVLQITDGVKVGDRVTKP